MLAKSQLKIQSHFYLNNFSCSRLTLKGKQKQKIVEKIISRAWFRSTDLWVMGPARFHCATLLLEIITLNLKRDRPWSSLVVRSTRSAQQSNMHGKLPCMFSIINIGFVTKTTAYRLGRYSLYLLLLRAPCTGQDIIADATDASSL